ncbi:MAG: hypothetical protein QMD92_04085 [bacterium]|nr:hypothetical protein [bacterium]
MNRYLIYTAQFLEHFPTAKIPEIFIELYRVLKYGSLLQISVPDMDKICKLYVKNIEWFTPPNNLWLGMIYGRQRNKYDFHLTGLIFYG